jgi:enamine deaminase RidA (YjgF/YER057c/UK114 family)
MPAGNISAVAKPSSRLRELGLVLPKAPTPLGAYVEASQVGSLLFLSGTLPIVDGKLAISGRLGANLSVEQGREAARLAALNALAAAQAHVGDLDRVKKLVNSPSSCRRPRNSLSTPPSQTAPRSSLSNFSALRRDTSASSTVCTARQSAHQS